MGYWALTSARAFSVAAAWARAASASCCAAVRLASRCEMSASIVSAETWEHSVSHDRPLLSDTIRLDRLRRSASAERRVRLHRKNPRGEMRGS